MVMVIIENQQNIEQKVEEIKWCSSFKEAQAIAEEKKMPIMVDFTAEWCGWCKKLDETTYKDPEVIRISKSYVNVKVDVDQKENQELNSEYQIIGLPTIVFMREDKTELERAIGYKDAEHFKPIMEKVLEMYKK